MRPANKHNSIRKRALILCFLLLSTVLVSCGKKESGWSDHDRTPLGIFCFDVGKGDCIVVRAGDHVMMIDTGYADTADSVSNDLQILGIDHIDEMIITHYDKDHFGGASAFLKAYPTGTVYVPDYLSESDGYGGLMQALDKSGARIVRVNSEQTFEMDCGTEEWANADGQTTEVPETAQVRILPPLADYDTTEENDNDMSLITELRYGQDSFIFLGDIEKESISHYLEREQASYDIMKFPHHGDWKKNVDDLVEQINPQAIIITDGTERPIEEKTEDYLERTGRTYYSTLQNGTIAIYCYGQGTYDILTSG